MSVPDERLDALYGLPLERFVPERDALAKELRGEGDKAGADEVRRLPKPTRAAWAVNRAIREQPEAARALADSARLLAEAQQESLGGGDGSALREAGERARKAVDALAAAAPSGTEATAEKVRETLHAATVDPEVLEEVAAGRVVRERVASGFGALAEAVARAGRPVRAARGAKKDDAGATAARDAARRREKLRKAKEAEAAAEHDVSAARLALEQVESALTDRRAQLRQAEARLKDARRRRERAET
jgi:hypothetical protein